MSTHFITNQEKLLSDVVKNILPSSEKLYFLIGYFYFSGFQELYKHVNGKEIKILVGLDIEHDLANKIREYEIVQEVPHKYLIDIIDREKKIDEGREVLILSEELI